jgi:hypothetical protein
MYWCVRIRGYIVRVRWCILARKCDYILARKCDYILARKCDYILARKWLCPCLDVGLCIYMSGVHPVGMRSVYHVSKVRVYMGDTREL